MDQVLTIAGSDSGGGAGIQADLKTFWSLGLYGTTVITAVTAQNTVGISEIHAIPAGIVRSQIDSVASDFRLSAVKTGMLCNREIVEATVAGLEQLKSIPLVVDPVMTATSGSPLLENTALESFKRILIPRATVVTPNIAEAERLSGIPVRDVEEMKDAAARIVALGTDWVVVKGGHLEGGEVVDVCFDGNDFEIIRGTRIVGKGRHGTGCVHSAAITCFLAVGCDVPEAAKRAHKLLEDAIRKGTDIGKGTGPADLRGMVEKESDD